MGHQDQDGEKVGQMSLFDQKLEAATDREKQKSYTFKSYNLILDGRVEIISLNRTP